MSDVLVDPDAAASSRATVGDGHGAGGTAPASPGARRRRWLVPLAVIAVLVAFVWLVPPVGLIQDGDVTFDEDTVNRTIEEFDDRGVYALRYVHEGYAEIRVPVRNDGWLPTTVTGVALDGRPEPMIVPVGSVGTPVQLSPGETETVAIHVRFDNCEYYTERAVDLYRDVTVSTSTLGVGRAHDVVLDHDLAVRSAVMTTCPDRVSDRGAFLRGG